MFLSSALSMRVTIRACSSTQAVYSPSFLGTETFLTLFALTLFPKETPMRQDLQQEFENLGKSQTATEALTAGLKEGMKAFFVDGLGKLYDSPTLNNLFSMGAQEMAAALFRHHDAHVLYPRASKDQPANDNRMETPG